MIGMPTKTLSMKNDNLCTDRAGGEEWGLSERSTCFARPVQLLCANKPCILLGVNLQNECINSGNGHDRAPIKETHGVFRPTSATCLMFREEMSAPEQ